jgi:hypothetical protein
MVKYILSTTSFDIYSALLYSKCSFISIIYIYLIMHTSYDKYKYLNL